MAEEKRFLNADDVASVLECSKSHAYQVMRQLNDELAKKGFIVVRGKVNAKYFNERLYDGVQS